MILKGLISIRVQGLHIRRSTFPYLSDVRFSQDLGLSHLTLWPFESLQSTPKDHMSLCGTYPPSHCIGVRFDVIMSHFNSSLAWFCPFRLPFTILKGLILIRVQGLHISSKTSPYLGDGGLSRGLDLPHLTSLKRSFGLLGSRNTTWKKKM